MRVRNARFSAGGGFRFTEAAFRDDKVIIDPSRAMLSLGMDGGPNLFRAMVRDLIAAETQHPVKETVNG